MSGAVGHAEVRAGGRTSVLLRHIGSGVGEAVPAVLVAGLVATVGLVAFSTVEWPAFNSSNVTRALTTVGQVVAAVLVAVAIGLVRVRRWPWVAKVLSWVGISTFVTVTLGMPLGATKLYLFGVSVDQEFRTEYLTRLTDSAALHDMTYADLPPFYPAGWFWIGGRVANVLGMDGWEAFKPYAIGSLAVAAVLSLVLWSKLIRADWAIGVSAATTAVAIAYASPEAYSAVIVLLLPPALVLAWGALHRPLEGRPTPSAETATDGSAARTAGGWGAVIGSGLFLGLAGTFYTLYFGVAVFAVGLMGLLAAALAVYAQRAANHPRRRGAHARTGTDDNTPAHAAAATESAPANVSKTPSGTTNADTAHTAQGTEAGGNSGLSAPWRAAIPPLVRLLVIAVITGVVVLVSYLPFLLKMLSGANFSSGSALHYLPQASAELPLPMVEFSLLGVLCLIGTVWLVVRASSSRRAQALGMGVVAIYLWSLLSMVATAAGTTLLSFRLAPVLEVLLAAAGAFGFVEGARAAYQAFNEPGRFRLAAVVVATVGALAFTQGIPDILGAEITTAYTDTDGDGKRADKRNPSAVSHYQAIDEALLAQTGRARSETVLLTADTSFLAFYPYYGFQGLTSHYANPLADFAERAATIDGWSKLETSEALVEALGKCRWRAPDAFLFRRSGDTYTLRLAKDVYPNDPNVERYTVAFDKSLFDSAAFTKTDIGPFTLITRR